MQGGGGVHMHMHMNTVLNMLFNFHGGVLQYLQTWRLRFIFGKPRVVRDSYKRETRPVGKLHMAACFMLLPAQTVQLQILPVFS